MLACMIFFFEHAKDHHGMVNISWNREISLIISCSNSLERIAGSKF